MLKGLLTRHTRGHTARQAREPCTGLPTHWSAPATIGAYHSDGIYHDSEAPGPPPLVFRFSWRQLWRFTGPGWLMSLAYLDPGNLESDLQQGATTGSTQIWVLWWSTVVGFILQECCARLGLVTGRDLAECVRDGYPRWVSLCVYFMMELAVTGCDIQEVVGSAIALKLLFGWPLWAGCLLTCIDTVTFLLVHRLGVRYLEALICLFIAVMCAGRRE